MKPLFVRELTEAERHVLQAGLRSPNGFTLRRCQIVLASARAQTATEIARDLSCARQTVRNALGAFEERGLAALAMGSRRPQRVAPVFDAAKGEQLRALLHESPRAVGKTRSTWTLALAADVCFERGREPARVSTETIRRALRRLGVGWRRAKAWITSPDPRYALKKTSAIG